MRLSFSKFRQFLSRIVPSQRLIMDELRLLAYAADASIYRLIPKLVVKVESEAEVIHVLKGARKFKVPLTFRAAGTSLSGQAVTDSVLVVLGWNWNKIRISEKGSAITLQPGVIGAHANRVLAPFGRKIGPDPASINSAMIGGIAANNASGMCCGTAQNSYQTLASMKIIFADGSVLDTADSESRGAFSKSRPEMISRILELARRVRQDPALSEKIRRKFKMKNTTGYSLNALVDFEDPAEIIQHLMIGSEGTLGFIAEITYRTVPDYPFKATALVHFPDMDTACRAVQKLANRNHGISACELMDAASLLIEMRADHSGTLEEMTAAVCREMEPLEKSGPVRFSFDPEECAKLDRKSVV